MSKGQPIIKARCPRELYTLCKSYLASRTFPGDSSPPTMSDLIIEALIEKMHHRERGKGIKSKRPTSPRPDPGDRRAVDGFTLAGTPQYERDEDGITVNHGELITDEED